MYNWLGATLASTTVSTDTEAADDMLNLSMVLPEPPASHGASDPVDKTDGALSDDDQLQDMFKILAEVPVHQDPTPTKPQLDPWVLMAEAKFKSGQRSLPPPPELRRPKGDPDTWNVLLRSIQTPKVTDTPVEVANPQNRDLLYLDQDANRDKALQTMQQWHRVQLK